MRHLGALRPANFQSCDSLSEKCPFQGWNRLKHQSYTAMLLSIPTPYFGFNRTKDTNLRFFTFPGFALGCFCCLAPALGNSERWCLDLLRFINGSELWHWSRIRLTCFPPQTLDKRSWRFWLTPYEFYTRSEGWNYTTLVLCCVTMLYFRYNESQSLVFTRFG